MQGASRCILDPKPPEPFPLNAETRSVVWRSHVLAGLAALCLATGAETSLGDEPTGLQPKEAFQPLFNGRDLTGWYTFLQKHGKGRDPDHVITIDDGAIHLYKNAADASTVVMGYIATEREFGDYHLRFQYRWGTKKFQPRLALKRDAGLYYHILGPDKVWPQALQFQVEQTNVGDLITLYGFQVDTWSDPKTIGLEMPAYLGPEQGGRERIMGGKGLAYQKHLAGDFELDGWNLAEVIAQGDSVVHVLNGHVINRARKVRVIDPDKPGASRPITRGRIALEIEAAEIYCRSAFSGQRLPPASGGVANPGR